MQSLPVDVVDEVPVPLRHSDHLNHSASLTLVIVFLFSLIVSRSFVLGLDVTRPPHSGRGKHVSPKPLLRILILCLSLLQPDRVRAAALQPSTWLGGRSSTTVVWVPLLIRHASSIETQENI